MQLRVRLICLAFALTALPQLAAAEICGTIFVPPDGVKEVCFGSCASPPSSEAEQVCAEVCGDPEQRRRNPDCGIFDEGRRRRDQECRDDERKDPDGECRPVICDEGERPEMGRCVPIECRPGSVLVEGRCVRQRMPPPLMCISPDELREVEVLADNAETLTERQLQALIALAASRGFKALLPDGTQLKVPPFGDLEAPQNKRFAASIDKSVKSLSVMCSASKMLSCLDPLTTLCQGQQDAADVLYDRLFTLGKEIDLRPNHDACVAARDPRLLQFIGVSRRAIEAFMRFEGALQIFDAIKKTETTVELTCFEPDVTQCGIGVVPFIPKPIIPLEKFARRKLREPRK